MKKLFLVLFIPLFFSNLNAQLELIIPDYQVENGDVFVVDVKTVNFDSIVSFQFGVTWDADAIEFIGVDNFGVPNLVAAVNFGLFQDRVTIQWIEPALQPKTLEDSTAIYSIKFRALAFDAKVPIEVDKERQPIVEFINANSIPVDVVTRNGLVEIGETTSTTELAEQGLMVTSFPNPATNGSTLRIEVNRPLEAQLKVWRSDGKSLIDKAVKLQAGENQISLEEQFFGESGFYFYSVSTELGTTTRKIQIIKD